MVTILRYELIKTYIKIRTYIGFALILVLVPLVYWGLSFAGEDMIDGMTRGLQQNFLFVGSLFNGWFVANMVMNALFVHVPFLILLVAGDILAGEANSGTYRILLTRPPARGKIFLIKTISTCIYSASLVFFLALVSVGLGLIMFGHGDMFIILKDGFAIIPAGELWWRFLLAYTLAAFAMCMIASLGILFSSVVENAIGPIVGSFAIVILMFIIGNLPIDSFETIRPYLFTTYLDIWQSAFSDPLDLTMILREGAYLGIYFCLFIIPAWIIFRRKDILS